MQVKRGPLPSPVEQTTFDGGRSQVLPLLTFSLCSRLVRTGGVRGGYCLRLLTGSARILAAHRLSMTVSLAGVQGLPFRIGKDLFVGRFHGDQALPLAFDNQRIRVVAPHKAAIAPLIGNAQRLPTAPYFLSSLPVLPICRDRTCWIRRYDNHRIFCNFDDQS